jgi:two-component system sensor histidine kinase PhoQ
MEIDVDAGIAFHADEGDLIEILGNVLDNACKWAVSRVRVRAGPSGAELRLSIDDDGPGIPADKVDAVLDRGVRADASTPGHGIGLAVVREIVVEAYGGEITVSESDLGGAAVEIRMPRR